MTLLKTSTLKKITLAVLALALVSWLGVGIYASRTKVSPSPPSSAKAKFSSKASFDTWPVYEDTAFSYQLHYPPEFTPKDRGAVSGKNSNLTHLLLNKEGKEYPLMGVMVIASPFEEFQEKILVDKVNHPNVSQISIAGSLGIRTFYTDKETEGRKDEVYFPSKDGLYTYRIFCFTEFNNQDYLDAFELMLSSFSFVG